MITFSFDNWPEKYFINTLVFSGGEVQVNIPKQNKLCLNPSWVRIHAELRDSNDVMGLLQVHSILRGKYPALKFMLHMGYVPYARQDRACAEGDSLAIKVFAELINSMKFDTVVIADPHSDVTPALINNCKVISQSSLLTKFSFDIRQNAITHLVAPDAGATKKTLEACKVLDLEFIQGIKHRDVRTGNITGFDAYGAVEGKHLLMVDDICDGGATFSGLATVLKRMGAVAVSLYVTHGIFSKGLTPLLKDINHVYTTNTLTTSIIDHKLTTKDWI